MDSEKLQRLIVACCMGGALCVGGASWAQQARVTSLLQVSKVTVSAGKASLSPAGQGKPGDLLEYRVRYDNRSHAAIEKFARDANALALSENAPINLTLVKKILD